MSIELRELSGDDLDAVFVWMRDPDAVRLAAFTAADPSDRIAFDSHRARIAANPEVLERAITSDGELVGTIASFMMEGDRELTYWVDPACWGRGIASRALEQFLRLEPTRPLFARVAEHNQRSARVVERAGFVVVGHDEGWANGMGRVVTETIYRLD